MNANELADGLEKYDWYYEHEVMGADGYTQEIKTCNTEYVWNAAAMLRTIPALQAEIEALKERCAFLEDMAVMVHTPAFPEGLNKTLRDLLDKAPLKDKP